MLAILISGKVDFVKSNITSDKQSLSNDKMTNTSSHTVFNMYASNYRVSYMKQNGEAVKSTVISEDFHILFFLTDS